MLRLYLSTIIFSHRKEDRMFVSWEEIFCLDHKFCSLKLSLDSEKRRVSFSFKDGQLRSQVIHYFWIQKEGDDWVFCEGGNRLRDPKIRYNKIEAVAFMIKRVLEEVSSKLKKYMPDFDLEFLENELHNQILVGKK